MIVNYGLSPSTRDQEASDKAALSAFSKEQLVVAILAEIDIDRGGDVNNRLRDLGAHKVFYTLGLPPTVVCQELDKPQSPRRKASLMRLLPDSRSTEVTQALLRQLSDRRPATEPPGKMEISHGMALRVCDVAINTLAKNLSYKDSKPIAVYINDARRDEVIQEVITELKLTRP